MGSIRKIDNINEKIKTVLIFIISAVDIALYQEYLDSCLSDGFTTYRYQEIIDKAREALDIWEVKLKIENKLIKKEELSKEEAIGYLGLKNQDQLRNYKRKYGIKVIKNKDGVNLYPLAELNRIKSIAPSLRK